MKVFRLCLILMLLSAPAAYAQGTAQEKTFNAESFTLENGMRAVVIQNHRVPVVTHMVWYGVGAADEAPGQSGIAHFVEHLMFKGTDTVPPGEFSKRVRALGGNDNAFTAQDITAYFQSISVDHLETVMIMEADRMRNLAFPPDDIDSERLVVLEERRQRTENNPTGYFFEQMRTALFPNHPYGNPVVGWLHEMEALTHKNVSDFYKKWYAPNNAILVVSGDITAAQIKPLAEKTYGVISVQETPERNWTSVPPLLANTRLVMYHPSIRQPLIQRLYRVPSTIQDKEISLALEVLTSIMGDGASSRFYKSLVVEQKIATSAGFRYSGTAMSDAVLRISATPTADTELETVEAAIDDELRTLVKEGVTSQELIDAKTRLIDAAVFARDSLSGPAMIFGYGLITGGTMDDIEYWPRDIEAVTIEQINTAARQFLDPDNSGTRPHVTGYILPPEEKEEGAVE